MQISIYIIIIIIYSLPPPPPKNTSPNRYSNVSRVSRVSRAGHNRRTSELLEQSIYLLLLFINIVASRPTETSFYDPSSGYYFDYINNNYYDSKTFESVGTVDDFGYPPKESFIKAKIDYDACYGDEDEMNNHSTVRSSVYDNRISNTSSVNPYKYSDNWNQYYADKNQWYNYDNKKGNYGEYGYGQEKYNKQDFKKDFQNYYGGDSKYYDENGKSYYQNMNTGTSTYAIPEEHV